MPGNATSAKSPGAPSEKTPAHPGSGAEAKPTRDFDSYMAQGDRLREREKATAALDAYDKAIELHDDRAEPYAGKGLAHFDLTQYPQAETSFKRALELNPRYGVAIIGLAETYRAQDKKTEAISFYEKYLEALPNGPEASVARSAIEKLNQ